MKRKITKQSHKPRHIRCELCESTQKLPILNEQNSSRDSNIGLTCSVFAIKIDLCLRINWRKKTPKPLIVKHQANSICKYISIGLFSRWFGSKSKKVKPIWILRRTDWARKIWIRKVLFEIISKSISLIFDKRESAPRTECFHLKCDWIVSWVHGQWWNWRINCHFCNGFFKHTMSGLKAFCQMHL